MQIITKIRDLTSLLHKERVCGNRIALVPTMGALHAGHISLVTKARELSQFVAMTIFVNPLQFNNSSDLEKYPRTLEKDATMAKAAGVDLLFAPDLLEIYPSTKHETVKVRAGACSHPLEGEFRPGHFDGVVTVVSILFNIFQPDVAIFGQKDFQQVKVIEEMVRDLHYQIEIITAPTIREPDGLAMSSRNLRLTQEQRTRSLSISRALFSAEKLAVGGTSVSSVLNSVRTEVEGQGLKLEYVAAVDPKTLSPVEDFSKPSQLVIAAWCDEIRLIDNVAIKH